MAQTALPEGIKKNGRKEGARERSRGRAGVGDTFGVQSWGQITDGC
jgi:hypothetical protein